MRIKRIVAMLATVLVVGGAQAVGAPAAQAEPADCNEGWVYEPTEVLYEELAQLTPPLSQINIGGTNARLTLGMTVTGTVGTSVTTTVGGDVQVNAEVIKLGVNSSVAFTVSASVSVSFTGSAQVDVEPGRWGYAYGGVGRVVTKGMMRYVNVYCTVLSVKEVVAHSPTGPVWVVCGETATVHCPTDQDSLIKLRPRSGATGYALTTAAATSSSEFDSYRREIDLANCGCGGSGGGGGGLAKAEPALIRDNGDNTMRTYRWASSGSSFSRATDYNSGTFVLSRVGNRVAAGDVDGDGDDDIVMAYQNYDGTFSFYVFKNGKTSDGVWYTSGSFDLDNVQGRLVVADFTGDGKAEPAMAYDVGDGTMRIYRWQSTGSSFSHTTDYLGTGTFRLSNVDDRIAAGDVTGDGVADVVMAHQQPDGTFSYYVWRSGLTSLGQWYHSGQFGLGLVGNRLVVGDFGGDSKAEPAMVYDNGDHTMTIYRWTSTGSSFSRATDYHSGIFYTSRVGDLVASGDVDGDGQDDIVMAYQNYDGTFSYYVFPNGSRSDGIWYTSGPYGLGPVDGRIVVGNMP